MSACTVSLTDGSGNGQLPVDPPRPPVHHRPAQSFDSLLLVLKMRIRYISMPNGSLQIGRRPTNIGKQVVHYETESKHAKPLTILQTNRSIWFVRFDDLDGLPVSD